MMTHRGGRQNRPSSPVLTLFVFCMCVSSLPPLSLRISPLHACVTRFPFTPSLLETPRSSSSLLVVLRRPFGRAATTTPKHQPKNMKQGLKMVVEAIKKVTAILMQLVWKAVRPADLIAGDHIYRYGLYGIYTHHGIYIGDGYVIHFTRTQSQKTIFSSLSKTSHRQEISSPCPDCGYRESINRGVVKTCLNCFRQDGNRLRSLHRYEYGWPPLRFKLARRGTCTTLLDTKLPHQVVDKASRFHEDNAFGDYSLINNNCEHFATYCRTDNRASEQVAFFSDCERKIKEAKEWTKKLLRRN